MPIDYMLMDSKFDGGDDTVIPGQNWGWIPGAQYVPVPEIHRLPVQDAEKYVDRRPHAPSPMPWDPSMDNNRGPTYQPEEGPDRGVVEVDYSIKF